MPVAESVVIRMGVQELRELIKEAVQKAVGSLQGERSVANSGSVAQEQVDEVVAASGQADQSAGGVSEVVVDDGGDEVLAAMGTSMDDAVDTKPDGGLQSTIEG